MRWHANQEHTRARRVPVIARARLAARARARRDRSSDHARAPVAIVVDERVQLHAREEDVVDGNAETAQHSTVTLGWICSYR